jgi:MoaA/NifB/PqqE/SkfB family radical SAM enzyme
VGLTARRKEGMQMNTTADVTVQPDTPRTSKKWSGLTLDLAYYCPLKCDHCLFAASPSEPLRVMPNEAIRRIMQSAAEVGTFFSISISHQEPFTEFNRLCRILRDLKENFDGYGVNLTTTCVWAKSREHALNKLGILKELLLDTLTISVDDFHQSQVPLKRCIDAASAAQELGIQVVVQCCYTLTSKRIDYFRAVMEPYVDCGRIEWVDSPVCPSGRARETIPESDWPRRKCTDGGCNVMEIMHVAEVRSEGV